LSVGYNGHKRRDHLFIMAEILEVTIDGALKTQVMYRANLSFAQLNEYLKLMLDMKLLECVKNSDRTFYKTTSKGMRYLQSYRELRGLLKKEGSGNGSNNGDGNGGVYLVKRGSQVICSKGPFY
jgi:predicted transcriptional regulator